MATPWPVYPSFLLLAILSGAACTTALLRRQGVEVARIAGFLLVGAVAALAGAKVFSWVERGGVVWWDPGWELVHGYRYPGGVLGLVAVAPVLRGLLPAGVTMLRLGDVLAPAMALSMAVVRLGCHFSGCCHGVATDLPWAVRFAPLSPAWHAHVDRGWIDATAAASAAVHPLQLYFGITSLALGSFLLRREASAGWQGGGWRVRGVSPGARDERRRAGETLCLFLMLDGLTKLLLEQLRLDYRAPLAWSAAALAVAGIAGLLAMRSAAPRHRQGAKMARVWRCR